MKPGRELDCAVAEKVMGWTRVPAESGRKELWAYPEMHPEANMWNVEVPNYSTDISTAWKVVEKIGNIVLSGPEAESNKWLATFDTEKGSSWGNTAPHAICLAALKAVGVDV